MLMASCGSGSPTNQEDASVTHTPSSRKHSNVKKPSIKIDGNRFVDEAGETITLRGVSIMGMEYTAISGFSPADPFPQLVESTWNSLKKWHINAIRIPLNEISYLGLQCVMPFSGPAFNKLGEIRDSDPARNYKSRLKDVVDRATRENLYVILDLHSTAPDDTGNTVKGIKTQCAYERNPLPDIAHSIDFWKAVAASYKEYPNVMFELFNNPFIDKWPYFHGDKAAAWRALRDGVEVNSYLPLWPTTEKHLWHSAGMQQLVDVVRSTGATNVILQSGISRSADLELWLEYHAHDPLSQSAAAWHAFPLQTAKWGDKCYTFPNPWCDERSYTYASKIIDANYPVIVTEFGDRDQTGTVGAPFASSLLPKLDELNISYFAWSFVATDTFSENELIKDNDGTPTDGYGQYVQQHYTCMALSLSSCTPGDRTKHVATSADRSPSESVARGSTLLPSPL